MKIDKDIIKQLSELMKEHSLTEIEIKEGWKSIKVSKAGVVGYSSETKYDHKATKQKNINSDKLDINLRDNKNYKNHPGAIKAPMVGTLYHSPSPEAKVFIEEGKKVTKGDTIFIIEAMKTMNQVKAESSGTVKKILIKNAEPVEFDDILAIID